MAPEGEEGNRGRVCKLGTCKHHREGTHGAGVGIAQEPAVTAAVKAAVWSRVRGKVTSPATLKTNEKVARTRPQVSERMQPVTGRQGVGEKKGKMRTQIRPAFQLSGTVKVTEVEGAASHLNIYE